MNNYLQLSNKDRDLICQQFMFGDVTGGKLAIESSFPEDLSRRELCLDILRPVADHLGELWRQDKAVFTSVRVALLRMEALLRNAPAWAV